MEGNQGTCGLALERRGVDHAVHGALVGVDGLVDALQRLGEVSCRSIEVLAVARGGKRAQRGRVDLVAHAHEVHRDAGHAGQLDDVGRGITARVLLAVRERDDHARATAHVRALERPVQRVVERRVAVGRERVDGAVEQDRVRRERLAVVHPVIERGDLGVVRAQCGDLVDERVRRGLRVANLALP